MWGAIISYTAVLAQDGKAAFDALNIFFLTNKLYIQTSPTSGDGFLLEHLVPMLGYITLGIEPRATML